MDYPTCPQCGDDDFRNLAHHLEECPKSGSTLPQPTGRPDRSAASASLSVVREGNRRPPASSRSQSPPSVQRRRTEDLSAATARPRSRSRSHSRACSTAIAVRSRSSSTPPCAASAETSDRPTRRRTSATDGAATPEDDASDTSMHKTQDAQDSPRPLPSNTIIVRPHPHSRLPEQIFLPGPRGDPVYPVTPPEDINLASVQSPYGPHPYSPFQSRADFEVSVLPVKKHWTVETTNDYFQTLSNPRVFSTPGKHSLSSAKKLKDVLESAVDLPFVSHPIRIKHNGKDFAVTLRLVRPYDYVQSLIRDGEIYPWIRFSAEKWFIVVDGGEEEVRGEGYTGRIANEYQDQMQPSERLLLLTYFTDESHTTSFVQHAQNLHTFVVWSPSVPQQARRAGTRAAPTVVGLLPTAQIESLDFADEKERTAVSSKLQDRVRTVIVEEFEALSHVGIEYDTPSGTKITVQVLFSQMSLDGKEAAHEFFVRSHPANHCCLRCFEDRTKPSWSDLTSVDAEQRSPTTVRSVYKKIKNRESASEKETIRKDYGVIRDEPTQFLKFWYLDPWRSLALDCLHTVDHGSSGDHLLPVLISEVKRFAKERPGTVIADVENELNQRCKQFLGYPLIHIPFDVCDLTIKDGNSLFVVQKILLIYALDLLPLDCRYLLARLWRALAIYRLIVGALLVTAAMLVDLEETLEELTEATREFVAWDSNRFEDPSVVKKYPAKYRSQPWKPTFWKWHAAKHSPDVIRDQGSQSHGDTRNGDGQHPEAKDFYRQTNRKGDVIGQLTVAYERLRVMQAVEACVKRADLAKNGEGSEDDFDVIDSNDFPPLSLSCPRSSSGSSYVKDLKFTTSTHGAMFGSWEAKLRRFVSDEIDRRDRKSKIAATAAISSLPQISDLEIAIFDCVKFSFYDKSIGKPVSYRIRLADNRTHSVLLRRGCDYLVGNVLGLYELEYGNERFVLGLFGLGDILPQRDPSGFPEVKWRKESNFFHLDEMVRPVLIQETTNERKKKVALLNDTVDLALRDLLKSFERNA